MLKARNSNIFIPDYWPLFETEEKRIFKYTCPDGTEIPFTSEFSYDTSKNSMRFESFDENSNWLNTWFYQYRPGFGLAEWRDDHPLDGWRRHIFGAKDRHVFAKPIGWGEYVSIGGIYENKPVKNTLLCWPPMFAIGHQHIHFEKRLEHFITYQNVQYQDVIVFKYRQKFGKRSSGARYYNARGIGPVAIEWIHYRDDGSEVIKKRIDAVVKNIVVEKSLVNYSE